MRTARTNVIGFVKHFLWTFVFLAIVVVIQVLISLEKIGGYPDDLWSSWFLQWWMYTAPIIMTGMFLVKISAKLKHRWGKLACNVFGRIMVFFAVLSLYLSLLAIG